MGDEEGVEVGRCEQRGECECQHVSGGMWGVGGNGGCKCENALTQWESVNAREGVGVQIWGECKNMSGGT